MPINDVYQAYLLRVWREDELSPWRASIQEVQKGTHQHFANLSDLFDFLRHQTEKEQNSNLRSA